jgi:integrase
LKSVFQKRGLGLHWSIAEGRGNPAAAPIVQDYLIGFRAESAEAHVVPKQAKPLFVNKLQQLGSFWKNELEGYLTRSQRLVILRDRAFFTLQYFSGQRAHDLSFLLGQELKLLPDKSGFSIRLTVGKQWQGEAHNDLIIKRCSEEEICPCRAMEKYCEWAKHLGSDLTVGFVFRAINRQGALSCHRWTAEAAYKQLKTHLRAINLDEGETPHGIRGAHAISVLLKGVEPRVAMSHVGWKATSTFSHYSRMTTFESNHVAETLTSGVLESEQQQCSYLDRESMASLLQDDTCCFP